VDTKFIILSSPIFLLSLSTSQTTWFHLQTKATNSINALQDYPCCIDILYDSLLMFDTFKRIKVACTATETNKNRVSKFVRFHGVYKFRFTKFCKNTSGSVSNSRILKANQT